MLDARPLAVRRFDVRRFSVALVALLGLVLAGVGVWLAALVGPSGTIVFRGTSGQPLLLTPDILNRADVPVTVQASSASGGPVWLGLSSPEDAAAAVGAGRHERVVLAAFPSRRLATTTEGDVALADPRPLQVWVRTASGSASAMIELDQAAAPQSVLVVPDQPGPVEVTVTWVQKRWFVEAAMVVVAGLGIAGFGGGWLYQQLRRDPGPWPAEREEEGP